MLWATHLGINHIGIQILSLYTKNYIKILTILSPIIPHYATECFDSLGINKIPSWPEVDKDKTKIDKINFVKVIKISIAFFIKFLPLKQTCPFKIYITMKR